MTCPDPQCDDGLVPNPYSDDPEDVMICPECSHGTDPRDDYNHDATEG
ncbi:hypothetical protein [Streptomyces sp. NPDC001415]